MIITSVAIVVSSSLSICSSNCKDIIAGSEFRQLNCHEIVLASDVSDDSSNGDRGIIFPDDYEDESTSFSDAKVLLHFYDGFAGYFETTSDYDYYQYVCPEGGDEVFQVTSVSYGCNVSIDVFESHDLIHPITSMNNIKTNTNYSFLSGGYTYYFKLKCSNMVASHFYSISFTSVRNNSTLLIDNLLFHADLTGDSFSYSVEYVNYSYSLGSYTNSYFPSSYSTGFYDYLANHPYYTFGITPDYRQVICNTLSNPFNAVARVEVGYYLSNNASCGSGAFISDNIGYTCAHLFVSNYKDGSNNILSHSFVDDSTFAPGRNDLLNDSGNDECPCGKFNVLEYYYPIAFLYEVDGGDWAIAVTSSSSQAEHPATYSHGYFGMKIISDYEYDQTYSQCYISGYPVLYPNGGPCYQWTSVQNSAQIHVGQYPDNLDPNFIEYVYSITGGNSGGPLYQQDSGNYYVIGNVNTNCYATRIKPVSYGLFLDLLGE